MSATDQTARLKTRYLQEIRPALVDRFGYTSVMQAPRLEKITLNMGVGQAKQDSKMLKAAREQLATIAGQQPSVRRARKSVAAFKLREGMPVGVAVTLRAERSYEFLDRLVSIAIPRIRDFRGLNPRSFDGRGNYSLGVREQIIFPEIDYDAIDEVRGLDITITTTASNDVEAYALLSALGMPFATQGRPAGFDGDAGPEAVVEEAVAEAVVELAVEEAVVEAVVEEAIEEAVVEAEVEAAEEEAVEEVLAEAAVEEAVEEVLAEAAVEEAVELAEVEAAEEEAVEEAEAVTEAAAATDVSASQKKAKTKKKDGD